jgi:hypothetical protein
MAYRPLASSFAEGIGSNEFHTASGDVCPVAINVFPAGSIPACRPVTYTKMIICSIDPSLVSELSAESDLPHKTEFSRRTNLRDSSLGNLITLLADDARSGGTSGRLYVELLTRDRFQFFMDVDKLLSWGVGCLHPHDTERDLQESN